MTATDQFLNTVLGPVVAALATVSVALLASGNTAYGLVAAVVTFAASYVYHVMVP